MNRKVRCLNPENRKVRCLNPDLTGHFKGIKNATDFESFDFRTQLVAVNNEAVLSYRDFLDEIAKTPPTEEPEILFAPALMGG